MKDKISQLVSAYRRDAQKRARGAKGVIYVAGAMTGQKQWGFPAFDRAQKRLEAEGWTVISPAQMDREDGFDEFNPNGNQPGFEWVDRLRWDVAHIATRCNAIYMLRGWQKSKGATFERMVAMTLGIEVIYER